MSRTTCSCPINCFQGTCDYLIRNALCCSECNCGGDCQNDLSLGTINPAAAQGTTPALASGSSAAQDTAQTQPLAPSSSTAQGITQPLPLAPSTAAVPKPEAVGERVRCNCIFTKCINCQCRCFKMGFSCIMGRCKCYDCDNNHDWLAVEDYEQCACKASKCKTGVCPCNKKLKECNPNCTCLGCENGYGMKGADKSNAGPGGMGGTSDAGGSGSNKQIRIG